jgi:Uri superfamily endonuclease
MAKKGEKEIVDLPLSKHKPQPHTAELYVARSLRQIEVPAADMKKNDQTEPVEVTPDGLVGELLQPPTPVTSTELKPLNGTYVLVLYLPRTTRFPRVGQFGAVELQRGYYTYTGSAFGPGGVRARVGRHADADKEHLRWQVDYVRPAMKFKQVWATYDTVKRECKWAKLLYERLGGAVPVPRMGASDCNRLPRPLRCRAHFCHFRRRPEVAAFSRLVHQTMPDHADIEVVDGEAVLAQAAPQHQ